MHQAVAHADDLGPGNLGEGFFAGRGDFTGSLTHDLDQAHDGMLQELIRGKLLGIIALGKFDDLRAARRISSR